MTFYPSHVCTIAYADSAALTAVMPWAVEPVSVSVVVGKRQHLSIVRTVDSQQEVRHR